MKIFCDNCRQTVGQVPDEKVPVGKKISVKCPKCSQKIVFSRSAQDVAPPPPPPEPQVDKPAADFEDTVIMTNDSPLPGDQTNQPGTGGFGKFANEAQDASPSVPMSRSSASRDFTVMEVIKESWEKTKGVKGSLWAAFLLIAAGLGIFSFALGFLMSMVGLDPGSLAISGAIQMTITVAMYPFLAGVMMIGVHRSVNLPVSFKMAFGYFSYMVPILIAAFLVSVLTSLGFILLVIPGIYLSVAYMLVIPLIIDKGMGPWEAMEASRKAITPQWFKIFFIYFLLAVIYMISAIPLGVGLIWTLPMFIVAGGIIYRNLFGISEATSAAAGN